MIKLSLLAVLRAVIAAAIILREIIAELGAPLWRLLARIKWLKWLTNWVARLPPWGVLCMVAAPLAIAEPLKIWGVVLVAQGHGLSGVLMLAIGYGVSLILAERILHAGRAQLMGYRWFALGWMWFERLRVYVLSLPLIESAKRLKREMISASRQIIAALILRLKNWARG